MPLKVTIERVIAAVSQDDYIGFCLSCGNEQGGVEPDAKKYPCVECGMCEVYGAEEVLLMLER